MVTNPTLGVYNDPSQMGDDVAAANANTAATFGTAGPSLKDQMALMRLQNSAMNPYARSLYGAHSAPLQDLSPSASWSEGLAKGAGNIMQGVYFRQNKAEEQQLHQDMMAGVQAQQQAAQQQAQDVAQMQAQQRQHILDRQGPDAAFAFDLSPKKFGEAAGTLGGQMPFVAPHAQAQALGAGVGQGQAHLINVDANQQYLQSHGVAPGVENQGQLTPQAMNITQQVTGDKPVDMIDFKQRQYELGQQKNSYQAGSVNNQTLGARNNAELTGKNLGNQGQVTENQIKQVELGFKAANEKASLNEKYMTQQEKAASMSRREAAEKLMQVAGEQMRAGKQLTPSDAARLDQTLKAGGIDSDFLGSLKTISNQKSGKSLTNESVQKATGSKGWVTLPSGLQYNPTTHEVNGGAQQQQKKPKKVSAAPVLDTGNGMPLTQLLPG